MLPPRQITEMHTVGPATLEYRPKARCFRTYLTHLSSGWKDPPVVDELHGRPSSPDTFRLSSLITCTCAHRLLLTAVKSPSWTEHTSYAIIRERAFFFTLVTYTCSSIHTLLITVLSYSSNRKRSGVEFLT